jgi:uncharacterized protein
VSRQPLRFGAAAFLVALAASYAVALAADFQVPPRPTTEVVDASGVMSDTARTALESELESFEAKTGHHVVVYIGQTTGDVPLETWTAETASTWKVGQKGKDDGAILFLFMKDHKVRIEVGYGLESTLTDALSKQIIDTVIVPRLKNGDTDAAVSEGAAAMLVTIDPTYNPSYTPEQTASDDASSSDDDIGFWGWVVGGGFLLVGLYIAFATFMSIIASMRRGYLIRHEGKVAADKDMKRSWLNFWLLSGAASSSSYSGVGGFFSGGGFGGGGGFSGGSFGGGFGGGGASGSW